MPPAKKRELKKGDLIEFLRGQFNHWAVYIGDGEVVHVTNTLGVGYSEASGNIISSVTNKALVKRETLESVAGDDKWQIKNYLDSEFEPRPENDIVKDALARVGEEVPFNVRTNNCEHFATELRYGEPHSKQVEIAKKKVSAMGLITLGLFAGASIVGTPIALIAAVVAASTASHVIANTDVSDVSGNKKKHM